ncbi:DUF2970 domain-containing protein [Candidatus Seongchinamella marina]|uniref:DUF2970 domain-containing protein n=1 Tax=Candidatus Seongchinamella marina TaxID=2518990 RepID=UPI002431AC2F|nr:DUF2970 domain-containing protein [Candidatus Seongchinamella marina]
MPHTDNNTKKEQLTFIQVMLSILASAFGVQTSQNRKRDFAKGNPLHFVISGILFTIIFVVGMIMLVNTILTNAT